MVIDLFISSLFSFLECIESSKCSSFSDKESELSINSSISLILLKLSSSNIFFIFITSIFFNKFKLTSYLSYKYKL